MCGFPANLCHQSGLSNTFSMDKAGPPSILLSTSCIDKPIRYSAPSEKFKGRNKRDNVIKDGAIVLIGKRDWEVRMPNKKEKVDLLYVYSQSQIDDLKEEKSFKNTVFGAINELKKEEDNGIEFTNDDYDEFEDINVIMNPTENQKLKETDINWDEI